MKHIVLLDPIAHLEPVKDSSLMLALALKKRGDQVFLLFENDFFVQNFGESQYRLYDFKGTVNTETFCIEHFALGDCVELPINKKDQIHMRLDPPFDLPYLRCLWMLRVLELKGVSVLNSPKGILLFNEKLLGFEQANALPSYVGNSVRGLLHFANKMKERGERSLILKPLDLFQGFGVERVFLDLSESRLSQVFADKLEECHGTVMAQPFVEEVFSGEIRSIFFRGKELGSILKIPPQGNFLANIAQGARFEVMTLEDKTFKLCQGLSQILLTEGIDWVAFDLLGGQISEANITCPGLLVEVSYAHGENLAEKILESL